MTSPSYGQYNLLLVGRTGNGKSSTGNSILGERAFIPGNGNSDDVMEFNSALVDGFHIQVLDGTGTGDTGSDAKRDVQSLLTHIRETLWRYVLNVHAIIVVLKYGVRFTKQEKDAVELIKSVFGKNVLKKWGVIVMTHGDNFEMDNEDENGTFEDWLKEQQTGDIQTLITECSNRCVLFNNREKDEGKKRAQRHNLMEKVKAIRHEPYTKDDFDKEENGRTRLLVERKLIPLQSKTDDMLRRVTESVRDIDARMNWDPRECVNALLNLQQQLHSHRKHLEDLDRGTGLLKSLLTHISVAELSVKTKMNQAERLISEQDHYGMTNPAEETFPIISGQNRPLWRRLWKNENFKIVIVILGVAFIIGVILLATVFG